MKLRSVLPWILVTAAILIFGAAAVVGYVASPPVNASWDNTAKAVGIAMAIAAGIFTPISSVIMAAYQARVTADLEDVKSEYTKEVENLKTTLAAGLEVKKALIAGKVRAFDQMLTSAHYFYYVIRSLLSGNQGDAKELLKEADTRAAEASSVVWHLTSSDRVLWFTVYQRSMHLANLLQSKPEADRQKIFEKFATPLGTAIEDLEKAGRNAFEEADRYQLKLSPEDLRIFKQ